MPDGQAYVEVGFGLNQPVEREELIGIVEDATSNHYEDLTRREGVSCFQVPEEESGESFYTDEFNGDWETGQLPEIRIEIEPGWSYFSIPDGDTVSFFHYQGPATETFDSVVEDLENMADQSLQRKQLVEKHGHF